MSYFNDYRFAGLDLKDASNNYWTCRRVSDDGHKIVVRVMPVHVFKSKFGYGFTLDAKHIIWLKPWQVSIGYARDYTDDIDESKVIFDGYCCEVILDSNYFNVKDWKDNTEFCDNADALEFGYWKNIAKDQEAHGIKVHFRKNSLHDVI